MPAFARNRKLIPEQTQIFPLTASQEYRYKLLIDQHHFANEITIVKKVFDINFVSQNANENSIRSHLLSIYKKLL